MTEQLPRTARVEHLFPYFSNQEVITAVWVVKFLRWLGELDRPLSQRRGISRW